MTNDHIIEVNDMSLEDWLILIKQPPKNSLFVRYSFPSEGAFQEYVDSIQRRSERDVLALARHFLIESGTLGTDGMNLAFVLSPSYKKLNKTVSNLEYYRRLLRFAQKKSQIPPWEGITWALDLLPHFPRMSLEVISAYFLAHAQLLPDGRLIGLSHAMSIIRAKFISSPRTQEEAQKFLFDLDSRSFEHLVERLFSSMNYSTRITKATNDGGRDILVETQESGKAQKIIIECKRHTKAVGVEICRSLLGVISHEKVNKGILVTSSGFTRGARKLANQNPRLELIDGKGLILLLNENMGPNWPVKIDKLVNESKVENESGRTKGFIDKSLCGNS